MTPYAKTAILTCAITLIGITAARAVPIPLNRQVTGPIDGLQNEEQAWICPNDTAIIITNHRDFRLGYRQIGIGRSTNNGLTWLDALVPPSQQVHTYQSDPTMTVNSAGDIIISHLDYDAILPAPSDISFLVSHDCGATWNGPYTVRPTPSLDPIFEDKQFITCDRTGGSHDGNVYISWTRFPNPDRIEFARSLDGAQTFEDTIIVGPNWSSTCYPGIHDAGQFSQPLVGKDGAVYVFWQGNYVDSTTCEWYNAIRFNKSIDAGVTWQGDRFLITVDGYNYVDGNIDVYSQPTTDADITSGPHAGNLYLQWRDYGPAPLYDSDILFMRSLDTGHTWSAPMRVNDDPAGVDVDQFHNWMVCNDRGILVSIWYDQRMDPNHYNFDVFAGYSYDGGATWTSNHRVSSVSSNPNFLKQQVGPHPEEQSIPGIESPLEPLSPMAGKIAEYIAVSSIGDIVAATWTDTRDASGPGQQDVYSARWRLPLTDPRLIFPLNGEEVDATPGLLWATAWKETEDRYRLQIDGDPGFGSPDLDVFVTTNGYDDPLAGFTDGTYYWRIKCYKAPGGTPTDSTAFSGSGRFLLNTVVCNCGRTTTTRMWCDVSDDNAISPPDVVRMVNYVYKSQLTAITAPPGTKYPNAPLPATPPYTCQFNLGDANRDGAVGPPDVVRYVNFVYKGQTTALLENPCLVP